MQIGLNIREGAVMFQAGVSGGCQSGQVDLSGCGSRAEILAENRGSLISPA